MNLLIDSLPTKIRIEDKLYDIDTDYRNCLTIIMAFEDDDLTMEEKYYITIGNLYKEIPHNLEIAIQKAMLFLNCGEIEEKKDIESVVSTKPNARMYSFSKDHKYIFSAINQASKGLLSTGCYIHWYLFNSLFLEIDKDCFFSTILSLRSQKAKGKLTKEEQIFWRDNKDILEIESKKDIIVDSASEEEIRNMEEFDRKFKEAQEQHRLQM